MRRLVIIITMAVTMLLATGCDFFRSIAGRPTSAEIDIKREMIAAQEAAHQAMLDSVKRVEKQLADSLALADSLEKMNVSVWDTSKFGGIKTGDLGKTYYIIIGAFMDKGNAERKMKEMTSKGHKAEIIGFKNQFTAVGICPTDKKAEASDSLSRLISKGEIGKDSWILVNSK